MIKKVMAKLNVDTLREALISKVFDKLFHIHLSEKALHHSSHYTDMTYLILVFITGHGAYTWAAGALFFIKVIGMIKHEEV